MWRTTHPGRSGGALAFVLASLLWTVSLPGLAQEAPTSGESPPADTVVDPLPADTGCDPELRECSAAPPPSEADTGAADSTDEPSDAVPAGDTDGSTPVARTSIVQAPTDSSLESEAPAETIPPPAAPVVQVVEAWAEPSTVTPEGGLVRFTFAFDIDAADLPVTVVDLSAVVDGDVAELVNSSIDDCPGSCCVPAEVRADSPPFGAYGWGCTFTATVRGSLGPAPVTISATVVGQDGSETVTTDTVVVTISDQFGAIHGVLLDETTGFFLRQDVFVFVDPGDGALSTEGVFAIEGLPPGEYRLGTGNSPVSSSDYAWEWYDDATDPAGATPVVVEAGTITRIEWRLSVGGVIEGTVVDAAGTPVAGVLLSARNAVTGASGAGETTAADGRFAFRGLSAGSYLVQAYLEPWSSERGPIEVGLGEVIGGVDFVIADGLPDTQPPAPEPTLPNTGTGPGAGSSAVTAGVLIVLGGAAVALAGRVHATSQ